MAGALNFCALWVMVMEEADTTDGSHPVVNMNNSYHYKILRSMCQINRTIDIDSWRLATEHKVKGPQFPCLMAVIENCVTRAVDAAKHVHFNPSTLLCIADSLESKGPVRCERNSQDRR